MSGNVESLLTDPESFFEHRARDPSLLYPGLIVTFVAVVGIVGVVVSMFQFTGLVDESAQAFLFAGVAVSAAVGLVGPFISWLFYVGLTHGITAVFDGEGEFTTTLSLVGWSFLPRAIGALLSLGVTLYIISTVQAPTDMASFTAYNQQIQNSGLQLASTFGIIAFKIWSLALMVFAVKAARAVDQKHAIIAVAVPGFIDLGVAAVGVITTVLF